MEEAATGDERYEEADELLGHGGDGGVEEEKG